MALSSASAPTTSSRGRCPGGSYAPRTARRCAGSPRLGPRRAAGSAAVEVLTSRSGEGEGRSGRKGGKARTAMGEGAKAACSNGCLTAKWKTHESPILKAARGQTRFLVTSCNLTCDLLRSSPETLPSSPLWVCFRVLFRTSRPPQQFFTSCPRRHAGGPPFAGAAPAQGSAGATPVESLETSAAPGASPWVVKMCVVLHGIFDLAQLQQVSEMVAEMETSKS